MSNQYPGGIITKNPATPTGPYETGAAPGIWTLTQQAGYKQQGVWPIAGNAANFIEEVFSCFLYTGTGASQTITNNIDLSTKGGLVWLKLRGGAASHYLVDTVRGGGNFISSNNTNANTYNATVIPTFSSSGFDTGGGNDISAATYVSWTFRKQPKFFDIVTYTGNGTQGRSVSHNLGSAPGFMIVKRTDGVDNWRTYHRSLGGTKFMSLDTTAAAGTANTLWNDADPTSTVFYLGNDSSVNGNGMTYVAYLFAHDAGGFGLAGTDNVISCGSFSVGSTTAGSVNIGFEPQWMLVKDLTSGYGWVLVDTMRGLSATGDTLVFANTTGVEVTDNTYFITPTATGFSWTSLYTSSAGAIYIAIRRGPMKVPTTGTSVFNTNLETTTTNPQTLTTGFPVDLSINTLRSSGAQKYAIDRLRGTSTSSYQDLRTNSTNVEVTGTGGGLGFDNNTGIVDSTYWNNTGAIFWNFRRAPSFFDEVCYTGGTGTPRVLNHNLTTPPELVITKIRNFSGEDWVVNYNNGSSIIGGYLNLTTAFSNSSTAPSTDITSLTSTTYTLNTSNRRVNGAYNYVAYLFATCAGVSKVGSYTGNGTTQTIDCGFGAGGARFVLIKRTDSTGDWYVYDTARGMTVLTDPYLLLNTTAAEVATLGSVTTVSTGFALNSAIVAAINVSAGSYIFLAIS